MLKTSSLSVETAALILQSEGYWASPDLIQDWIDNPPKTKPKQRKNTGLCNVGGCNKKAKVGGMCISHYQKQYYKLNYSRPKKVRATCKVDGCERPAHGLGYCGKHYQRNRTHGNPHTNKKRHGLNRKYFGNCKVDGCDRKATSKGYCGMHYHRIVKHNDPHRVDRAGVKPKNLICKVDGCETKSNCFGYCQKHYRRLKKWGDPSFVGKPGPKPKTETETSKNCLKIVNKIND